MRLVLVVGIFVHALFTGCFSPGPPGAHPEMAAPLDPGWPPLLEAAVRPGGKLFDVTRDQSSCSISFLFASVDNRTLFVSTASHCVIGLSVGDEMPIGKSGARARVAYCSYGAMDGGTRCSDHLNDSGVRYLNDFALLRLDDASRGLAHPATLHWGGPTSIATSARAVEGAITYGSSDLRDAGTGIDVINARSGVVRDTAEWITMVEFTPTSLPGDSGSAVMLADGRALGVLKSASVDVSAHEVIDGVVNLPPAIAAAERTLGTRLVLMTWPLVNG